MGNRSYTFEITWCWAEDGNRPENLVEVSEVSSTTVPRAISKLVRQLDQEDKADNGEESAGVKGKDIFVIDVRNHKLTNAIIAYKQANGRPGA